MIKLTGANSHDSTQALPPLVDGIPSLQGRAVGRDVARIVCWEKEHRALRTFAMLCVLVKSCLGWRSATRNIGAGWGNGDGFRRQQTELDAEGLGSMALLSPARVQAHVALGDFEVAKAKSRGLLIDGPELLPLQRERVNVLAARVAQDERSVGGVETQG